MIEVTKERLHGETGMKEAADGVGSFFQDLPKSFYVNCWHENTTESAAFWDQSGIDSVTYQPKNRERQHQAHTREREIPPGRPFHLAINLLAIHRYGESESPRTF